MIKLLGNARIKVFFAASLMMLLAGMVAFGAPSAHAAALRFMRGYSVQGSWLCYGFSNGAYHCTQHWYRNSAGLFVSLNRPFVPSQSSGGTSSSKPTSAAPVTTTSNSGCPGSGLPSVGSVWSGMHHAPGGVPNDVCASITAAPYGGALSLWKVPPAPFNLVYTINPRLYPGRGGWPTCSWWAREVGVAFGLGRGVAHSTPKIGATIHYAPGVLGASRDGHYGHVVAIYSNGWILSSEMNFYWRGGGAGRVIFRFIPPHVGGVSFIY